MKKRWPIITIVFSLMLLACNSPGTSSSTTASDSQVQRKCCDHQQLKEPIASITIDELFDNSEKYIGKVVSVEGLCIHTCRHSGKRMFLKGSGDDQLLLISATENIAQFENSLEGSSIKATGVIQVLQNGCSHNHAHGHSCSASASAKQFELICSEYKTVS